MFGKNEIVGLKYFADAGDRLLVTSMFLTLQGEGPFAGRPAFFVRLSKCNLACSFCDTYFDKGNWFTFDLLEEEIDRRISQYFALPAGMVPVWAGWETGETRRLMVLVITGGEPMLQPNLGPFLKRMVQQFEDTQIESNGIFVQDIPEETVLVVSPKCIESHDGKPLHYLRPKPAMLARANCLKFVMSHDPLSPYNQIPDWALEWHWATGLPIYISPMNVYNREPQKAKQLHATGGDVSLEQRSTVDEVISFWEPGLLDMQANQLNHEYAARYCLQHGLNLSIQMHLLASLA